MPYLKWVDFDSHGYSLIEVAPDYVRSDWCAVDGVLERAAGEALVASWMVKDGEPRVVPAEIAATLSL